MANDIIDPSQVGTSGLKGINTREGRERLSDKYGFSNSIAEYKAKRDSAPIELPHQEVGVVGTGDSAYDEDIFSLTQLENLEDTRAELQPWYSKIGAGVGKGAVLAGTTFLDGTMGTIVGAMNMTEALIEGKSGAEVFSAFWDNPFAKAMKAVNDWSEEAMPNYMSEEEKANQANGEWYKNMMTANWWGNSFIKNLGFTVGAFATGNLVSGALKGATPLVKTMVGSVISAINEGKVEAYNNSNDWYTLEEQKLNDTYSKYLETLEQNYGDLDIYPTLLENAKRTYDESLAQLNANRAMVGNVDLVLNIPILTASNAFMWGKLYGGGANTAIRSTNIARRNGKYISEVSPSKIITGPLSEGFEEVEQKMASVIPGTKYESDIENFYKSKWDPEASEETLSWVKATAQGIASVLGDSNTWEEFTIGAMTGALGMPQFRSPKAEDGSYRSPVFLGGGIYGEVKDYIKDRDEAQSLVDKLNERVSSPEFRNYYQGIVRHSKYQNDMDKAAEDGNVFDYKNAEDSQTISDIIMFANAGRLNDLTEYINQAFDTSDENIQSIIENTTDKFGNGPFSDNGNSISKDEIVKKLTESKDNILQTISDYREAKNYINSRLGDEISEDALEELVWLYTKGKAWNKRFGQLAEEVKHQMRHVAGDIELRHPDKASVAEDIRTLLSMPNELLELTLSNPKNQRFTEVLSQEAKRISDTFGLDYADLSQKVSDMIKMADASDQFDKKLREYIEKPENLNDKQAKDAEEIAQEDQNKKNSDLKTRLSSASSVEEFRNILSEAPDITTRDEVLNLLDSEGSQVARNYKDISQYERELNKAINSLGENASVTQDALKLWEDHKKVAENLEQVANPNSIYINNEDAFIEDSEGDIDMADNRFQNARYALQRAMSKVNNDIRFKNRFSEEYRRPVSEPVKGKGIDKDSTGDSGTSTVPYVNPNATPVETPSIPVGNVTAEMVAAENRDANRRVETQRSLDQSQQGQRRYYRPAVPELHIEASKEGDFRPFDVVVAEREPGVDFSGIYNYLRDNEAFSYVNAAKIKPGDTLGFMIDPDFNDHTIFLVDTRNNQIVGSIDESDSSVTRYEGLEEVIKKVRDEFSKRGEESTGKFFATPQTRVSKMMVGRIPYGTEDRSLADIPGVLDGDTKPVFGIIKNGALTTNEKVDDRLIIKPVDMAQKEGRLYLLIPNAAGTYSPTAVRVKHFNNQEFNLDDATVANTPIGRGINEALDRLADATSQDDVSVAMKELAQDIYMQDVMVTWFDAKAGSGIVISRKVRRSDGTYEMVNINSQEQIKENKYTIYYQSSKKTIDINGLEYTYEAAKESGVDMSLFGQPREASEIRRDILNTILGFNLPIQVSASRVNDSGYNNRVIKSNVLTSNLREAKVIGSWFTTDYFDKQGNLQRSVSPSSVKPAPGRRTTTPVGGTEGVIQGTPVRVGNSTYTVDLKTMVYTDSKGVKYAATTSNANIFAMAWAQENFGDSTESSVMTENKVITPQGRVLDRNTGTYVSDAEAKRIKDKIAGRNQAAQNRIAESKRVIADIYENQKRVDKARTNGDYYYILEDDGQYHEYSRVHSRLGDNWLGERTETENSRRALKAGTAVDKVIRDFFTSKETPVKPETLSESAFIDLISKLTEIKSKMEQMGETFMADNIVLFQKYTDGTRVAGEVDILSVDKNGNFKIYDVKTSRYSFGDRYFTEKSSKQRMSTKDYYTLQLSAYQNLFESQYGVRPVRLAILPFVLSYDKDRVASITGEKGILIEYNPAVNVPLASAVQAPQQQEFLPIFDALVDGTMETENRALPENDFEDHKGSIGVYEKDGKLYTGYLKNVGEIDGVPIHLTKVRDKGFGRAGEFGSTSEYLTVFPNGMAISTRTNDTNDDHAAGIILEALSKNPAKVHSLASEKTQISDGFGKKDESPAQPSGATITIQKEGAANKKAAKRTRHKLRAVDNARPTWDQEKELVWLKRVLPQLSEQDRIRVVKGLIQVAENGPVAWGRFSDGIIELSDIAAEGTTYHEAFHAVFHLMLTSQEREALLEEAMASYGNNTNLEEEMAEGFREYVASQETRGLGRKILDFFQNLFAKVTNWKYMKPSLINYYRMINQGKYAKVEVIPTMQVSEKRGTSFSNLSSGIRQALEAKGWTQEKFDSISQRERDQAVECVGL